MSLKRLQYLIQAQGEEIYPEVIAALSGDPRGGAQKLVRYCQARLEESRREQDRLVRMYSYERQVWAMGYQRVAGIDEAGRGPLAGPVVAAAVILPREETINGLDDIKRLTPRRRQQVYEEIRQRAVAIGIGTVDPDGIDESNVLLATYKAMAQAIENLSQPPDYLLVDSLHIPGVSCAQSPIVGGETLSASIAAAAVVAKVTRDQYMIEMDKMYPQYGFANHKGYGTPEHRAALAKYGPCPIHRRMTGGVRELPPLSLGPPLDQN